MDPLVADLIAGGAGGAIGVFVGHPLDSIKVRMQALRGEAHRSAWESLRHALRTEGPLGLYRGSVPPMLNSFLANAAFFAGHGHGKALLDGRVASPSLSCFLAGMYAGVWGALTVGPPDLIKCQMQVDRARPAGSVYRDGWHCARAIVRREGPRGLLRGMGATLVREVPNTGLYFLVFETVEPALDARSAVLRGDGATLVAGGCAGTASWAFAMPADVVKSHIQALPLDAPRAERTLAHAVRTIYAEHGVAHFVRGMGPCLLRAFPVNAITLLAYSRLKDLLVARPSDHHGALQHLP